MPRTTARDVAAFAVMRVVHEGAFSNLALRTALREFELDRRDRAFATRLTYGTLTWLGYIDIVLNTMLPKGINSLPEEVACHLRVAMYQLLRDQEHTPVHAAIDECVELVGAVEPKLRGLTNGVLRNFERAREDVLERVHERFPLESKLALSPSVSKELLRRVDRERANAIMARWNGPTPVVVRARDGDRDGLAALLADDEAQIIAHPLSPDALIYQGDIRNALVHGARVAVQDAGAQLVAHTLPPDLRGVVVDACAGLGGKALHLLDQLSNAELVAADIDKRKLARIADPEDPERLARVAGDMATYAGAEALALHAMNAGIEDGYAAIVIDAPCSALGTLGRHPEVRWRRTEDDIASLSRVQRNLLKSMAPLVQEGGYLVYVVCTFTEAETMTQVDRFLQTHPDFVLAPPDAETADPRVNWAALYSPDQTISLWPDPHESDGFFIARFQKIAGPETDESDEESGGEGGEPPSD